MSREVKIGILFIVTAALAFWGFNFLKGKNLLNKSKTFYVVYDNVDQLTVASPVQVNGFQIGTVMKMELNPENLETILVTLDVDGDIQYPKNTKAILKSGSLVGGKIVELQFNELCNGSNCAVSGDKLEGEVAGLLSSIMGDEDLSGYSSELKNAVAGAIDTLNAKLAEPVEGAPINSTFQNLQKSMDNMASATASMERLMRNSQANMTQTFSNLASLTNALAESQSQIKGMLANMETLTGQMIKADISATISKTNQALEGANGMITDLQGTLGQATNSFEKLNGLLSKLETGDGLVPQLLHDKELYTNLNDASKHMALLLQDMRLNPKRYVRLSVFGRKGNAYTYPENDPASENYKPEGGQ